MSEKTEKATPYKLKKAKEKGIVSKSVELTSCSALLITLVVASVYWPIWLQPLQSISKNLFQNAGKIHFNLNNILYLTHKMSMDIVWAGLPLIAIIWGALIAITLIQTGFVWAPAAISPDFKRLNPVTHFKKWFSIARLFDAVKSLIKIIGACALLLFLLYQEIPHLMGALINPSQATLLFIIPFIIHIALKISLFLFFIAFMDKKFTLWQFDKEQKMSKQEIKDEYRQKEGDPKIKSKLRQLQKQLRQKTAGLKTIKEADVIITNPTHIAIALQYDKNTMPAPKVLYKAQNKMVSPVKKLARKYNIPVIEHKVLARMLHYSTDINQYIHKDLFPLAAGVFRQLYQREQIS